MADAAPGTSPRGFTRYASRGTEPERRSADRNHVRVVRGVESRIATVARRRRAHSRGERAVCVPRRLSVEFGGAPAVADDARAGLCGVVDRREEVVEGVRLRLDEQDARLRRHCVRPLDVERDLQRPATIEAREPRAAGLVHLPKAAVGGGTRRQPELRAERIQVLFDVRMVEGVDNRNGLPCAGVGVRRKTVGCPDLRRSNARGRGGGEDADVLVRCQPRRKPDRQGRADPQHHSKCRAILPAADGPVAVEDLLQDFYINGRIYLS